MQLTPSMAIYDTMQSLQSPVGTHCVGYAYNLAAFLLAAGEKVIAFSLRIICNTIVVTPLSADDEAINSQSMLLCHQCRGVGLTIYGF